MALLPPVGYIESPDCPLAAAALNPEREGLPQRIE